MKLCMDAVPPELITVLRRLMNLECLQDFYLVGGTALALRFGHRESVDIDLFTSAPFDSRKLLEELRSELDVTETETSQNTFRGVLEGVKVECIAHQYPLLEPIETLEGIRMASLNDLAAFKANAIANRGAKKDFWDLRALLGHIELADLLSCCGEKYQNESIWNLEKSMLYFDDAEQDPDPRDLSGTTWEQIKEELIKIVRGE